MAEEKRAPERERDGEVPRVGAEIVYVQPTWVPEDSELERAFEDWVTCAAPPMKKSA